MAIIRQSVNSAGIVDGSITEADLHTTLDLSGKTITYGDLPAANLTGSLPAIDGSALTGIDALPDQTGNSGLYLTTDGTNTSWSTVESSQWTTTGSDIYYNMGKVGIGGAPYNSKLSIGVANQNYTGSQPLPNSTVTILEVNGRADLSFVSKREDAESTQNVARIEAQASGGWNSKLNFYTANNWYDPALHAMTLHGSNLQFNSGYGSVATAYGCRAWVNFDGDEIEIRASGNVSSITDNGTGDYTVNFTTAMPDSNFAMAGSSLGFGSASNDPGSFVLHSKTASNVRVKLLYFSASAFQATAYVSTIVDVVVFR